MKAFTKKIVLEDGREFYGYGFGSDREAINEIVFNTSMDRAPTISKLGSPSLKSASTVISRPSVPRMAAL